MKRPRFSVAIGRLLLRIFSVWAKPLVMNYREPRRAGTPHGEKIGLSRSKYFCALLQALHGPFSVPELSVASFSANFEGVKLTGASTVLMKLWRTEVQFRDVAEAASQDFAKIMLQEVQHCIDEDDYIKGSCLLEGLAIFPGFGVVENKLVKIIANNPEFLSCYNEIREFYEV